MELLLIKSMLPTLPPSVEDCAWSPLLYFMVSVFHGAGWLFTRPGRWTCTVCRDSVEHLQSHLKCHTSSTAHKRALEYITNAHQTMTELPQLQSAPPQALCVPSPSIDDFFNTKVLSTMIETSVGLSSQPLFVCQANDLRAG